MKHLKKFNESYEPINEGLGLALLAGFAGTLALGPAYKWAKNYWSKNVVGSKYKETGATEKVVTKLPKNISTYISSLSIQERDKGEVVTELKEYEDNLGNKFWGYDHLHSDSQFADFHEYVQNCDFYTALYKAEDLEALKKFLVDSRRYTGEGGLSKPNPIEMIWKGEGPRDPGGNY